MADRVGQQLGNYQLIRLLGEGGFAEVYLGEHIYLKTQAAIKILQMRLASEDREGFLKEARTIAGLKHPHIIRVFDFGIDAGTPFLVMDYAPHGTLRRRHPKGIPLALSTIVNYVKQVAPALQYAHERKLVHRDVKPENVLLGEDDEALLSDFGIALVTQSSRYQSTQEVAGTAAYMAPEQLQGKPRPASDQYALGITVYEWVCGDRPFHGTFTELYSQHLFVPPPPLQEKVRTIPPAVDQVVLTALEKDPLKRFASVQAFATALEQANQVKRPEPEPEPVVPVLETTGTHQSQQLTEMATPPPVIPFSQQPVSEVLANTPAQPQTIFPLSGKVARSSKSPALRPDAMVAVKPAKPGTSRRFVLLVALAGLVIGSLASGIAWLTLSHPSPTVVTSTTPTAPTVVTPTAPAGVITEFPLPAGSSGPDGTTAGPDSNLWFTEQHGNKIGRITSGK